MDRNDKQGFPSVELWKDYNKNPNESLKDESDHNSLTLPRNPIDNRNIGGKDEEMNQIIKTYNNRRLSSSFPDIKQDYDYSSESTVDIEHLPAESFNSAVIRKELSKLLSLILIQGLSNCPVSGKGVSLYLSTLPQKLREEYISNILQSLVTVLSAAINSPSEKQILDYCQNVLAVVADDDNDSVTCVYFFRGVLLSRDPLLKHAALALLYSYCSKRKFDLLLASSLLSDLISLYRDGSNQKVLEFSAMTVIAVIQNLKHTDQVKLVSDVCLAVKHAMFCSKDKEYLPGLCNFEGFDSIFPLYEKVLLKGGTMKDKRLAVRAIQQLILFSSEEALMQSLCSLASVLSCVLVRYRNDRCTLLKIALVETLTTLIAKVGIKLKPYFRRLETTFFRQMKNGDKVLQLNTLQLKCIRALCCLARFNDDLDNLFEEIFYAVSMEPAPSKKANVFLLRCIIKCSCVPIPEDTYRKFLDLNIELLTHSSDMCRKAAAGCIGTMYGYFPFPDFFDDDESLHWCLRLSKCTSLMVALKESPSKLLQGKLAEKITEVLLSYMVSNQTSIVLCGIKACGFYILYKVQQEDEINPVVLDIFCETMKRSSEDVRQTFAVVVNYLANRIALPLYVIKTVAPILVNGTKDENSVVKSSCESALVAVLDLYNGDEIAQMYLTTLGNDDKESLKNHIADKLKEIVQQPKPKVKELDFTLIV